MTNAALVAVAEVDHRTDDLGDDVAGLAEHHRVADQHSLADDLAGVVQRRHAHGRSSDLDRLHDSERGYPAGAPTLTSILRSLVVTSSGGYLYAIAQRGARDVEPS